jgi:cation transport ATPase
MKKTYIIEGMTCGNCKTYVEKYRYDLESVTDISVDFEKKELEVPMDSNITIEELQKVVPEKYNLSEKEEKNMFASEGVLTRSIEDDKTKLQQLNPLLLVLFYITTACVLLHYKDWSWSEFMLDFMGLFYIVFKMLDLKYFPMSFKRYDLFAKRIPVFGRISIYRNRFRLDVLDAF